MKHARRRGQPLVALFVLLVGWTGARALMWGTSVAPGLTKTVLARTNSVRAGPLSVAPWGEARSRPDLRRANDDMSARDLFAAQQVTPPRIAADNAPLPVPPPGDVLVSATPGQSGEATATRLPQIAAARPARVPAAIPGYEPDGVLPTKARVGLTHWSADTWFLWRSGGTQFNSPGAGLPGANLPVGTYGASQYGAVLRYRLTQSTLLRPAIYLRGTGSTEKPRYEEVAAGLSIRPLARLPVAAVAELRATRSFGQTHLRPATALISELPLLKLPFAVRGEAYFQAGYVGGQGATVFFDGQLKLDRQFARVGSGQVRFGAGAWGGAQEGARRLDIGPSASIGFATGGVAARITADWRFRVAGRAAPLSGPAVTLSAGF